MRPNFCCNMKANLKRKWHQDTLVRKFLRLFRDEELPHRFVETCRMCGCKHYILIVPEIDISHLGLGV